MMIPGIEGPLNKYSYYFFNGRGEPIQRRADIMYCGGGRLATAMKEYECGICALDHPISHLDELDHPSFIKLCRNIQKGDMYVRVNKWGNSGVPCHVECAMQYGIEITEYPYHWRDNRVKFKFVNGWIVRDE